MNIQKPSGMNTGAVSGKASGKPASAPPAAPSAQTVATLKMPAQTTKPVPVNSLPSLIAAAGLPADKLSASIISFARFFSLPLKPDLMVSIRRQGLLAPEDATKGREAFSLAAAAAEGKGVELRPKGLELFAEAINPDLQRRDSDEHKRDRRDKGQDGRSVHEPEKTAPLSAAGLKEAALESAEKDPLLAVLNRLPGKNGRRWVVLPFSFCESGRKYRISLRILLETDEKTPDRAVCMAMDIAEGAVDGATGDERRWSFVLADEPATKLTVYLQPELPPEAIEPFALELSQVMGMPPENVSVKSLTEAFPGELGDGDLVRSINKAV